MIEFIKHSLIKSVIDDDSKQYIAIVSNEQISELDIIPEISTERINQLKKDGGCRLESCDGYDLVFIEIMDAKNPLGEKQRVCMYIKGNILIFIGDYCEYLSNAVEKIKDSKIDEMGIDDVLYYILYTMLEDDFNELEIMEENITRLEEEIVIGKKTKCMREIMRHRRNLLEMKKFYQQMYILCNQIIDNENGTIRLETVRYFKNVRFQLDRLMENVLSLRDYVSQVLDAYQSQVDISLNNIMKFFTVVTTIFMPLTLITGWYGMNLKMPEFAWEYGYICVIILSVAMVSGLIAYFKMKHWF